MSVISKATHSCTVSAVPTVISSIRQSSKRNLASHVTAKKEGDISSVFVSLSCATATKFPERYADIERNLIRGNEDKILDSWKRLLKRLAEENAVVAAEGSKVIPQIQYADLDRSSPEFVAEAKNRGVAVVRGVIPEDNARAYKTDVEEYVRANPRTKGKSMAFSPAPPITFKPNI